MLLTVVCSMPYITGIAYAQNVRQQVDSLNKLSFSQLFDSPTQSAMNAVRAAKLSQNVDYRRGLGRSFTRLGILYDLKGSPDSAALLLNMAIPILEQEKDTVELSIAYNNLGIVHYGRYDYDKAIYYYKKSIGQDRLSGDIRGVAGGLQNIAILYTYKDNLATAEKIYTEAEALYRSLNDSVNLPMVLSNRAKIFILRKDFRGALPLLREADRLLPAEHTGESRVTVSVSLSHVLNELGQHDEALTYALKALDISREIHSVQRELYAYDQLQEVYRSKGDYPNAYKYLRAAGQLNDSLHKDETGRSISEIQARYDVTQKDEDLQRLRLEKEAANNLARAKENSRNFALALAFALLLVLAYIFSAWRSGKKINRLLHEKNRLAGENLEQKDMLIDEIHHRIKNNLQLIGNLLDFQSRTMDNERAAQALEDSKNRVASMAMLHRFLYTRGDYTHIDIRVYLQELAQKLRESYGALRPAVNLRVEADDLKIDSNTSVAIGLIINELTTNAYKYAFGEREPGEIFISLAQTSPDLLTLKIRDNGRGMPPAPGTGFSFGTRIVDSLCRQLRAEWKIENTGGVLHTLLIKKFRQK